MHTHAGHLIQHDLEGHNFVTCHVKECDILVEYKRWKPGNTPRTRWKGGLNIKLEGSDHAPVYMSFGEVPVIPQHSTPSLASRYLPMICGLQQTLVSVLMRREVAKEAKSYEALSSLTTQSMKMESFSESAERSFNCHEPGISPGDHCSFANQEPKGEMWKMHENHRDLPNEAVCNTTITAGSCKQINLIPSDRAKKKARKIQSLQLSLRSFFHKSPNPRHDVDNLVTDTSLHQADVPESPHHKTPVTDYNNCHAELHDVNSSGCSQDQDEQDGNCSLDKEKNNVALLEWQRIRQLMENSIPLCKGHKEPCVARVVKKPGPTFGRRFYVCARAEDHIQGTHLDDGSAGSALSHLLISYLDILDLLLILKQIVVTLNGLLQNPSTKNDGVSWSENERFKLSIPTSPKSCFLSLTEVTF
ncbi:hypothetical protein Patl1_29085 [Pistacia atlantica]|uniref:Uncharacterized protein n=1 Tax=Pistacia atlantica TaxID=434234 RepID=A0ACC1BGG7_9ROSI|nr:hypothetical protein Patl1_29085 [Pistacia atlantica]